MYGVIYKFVNKLNGRVYIGQTTKSNPWSRIKGHLKAGTCLGEDLRGLGISAFDVVIIDDAIDADALDLKEMMWIAFFNSIVPNGYNKHLGGQRGSVGFRHTVKTRELMSAACRKRHNNFPHPMLGKHHREDTKKKLSEHFKRMPRTAEHCNKISLALKGKKKSSVHCKNISLAKSGIPNLALQGKPLAESTKLKISASRIGRFSGSENAFFGERHSPETRVKMKAYWAARRALRTAQ